MANNNLPAHDFAPPWLKIPSYDCHKPVADYTSYHTSRRDEHGLIGRDHEDDFVHRHHFDSKRDRDSHSGDRKGSFFPSRHSSIDIEDGNLFQPGGHLSKSQPSLLRRPSSRHDFRGEHHNNTFCKGGLFSEVNCNGSPYGLSGKGCKGPIAGHQECTPRINGVSEGTNGTGIDVTSNNFNQEFPSLNGCEADPASPGLNGSVWENPLNAKVHGVGHKMPVFQRPLKEVVKEPRSKSPFGGPVSCISPKSNSGAVVSSNNNKSNNALNQPVGAVYRALIPAKSTHSMKMGKDVSRPTTKRQTPPLPTSSLVGPMATQNMEILVKNPRMRGCNKSHFLKTLRVGDGEEPHEALKEESMTNGNALSDEDHQGNNHLQMRPAGKHQNHLCENGIEILPSEAHNDHHLLSSSLEAEQRLLKEMGWKEDGSDDDAYAPLTEDELKEFRDLAIKFAEKKNGVHNVHPGLNASAVHHQSKLNWSPKHLPPFSPLVLPPNEEEGSWSSTSDSD